MLLLAPSLKSSGSAASSIPNTAARPSPTTALYAWHSPPPHRPHHRITQAYGLVSCTLDRAARARTIEEMPPAADLRPPPPPPAQLRRRSSKPSSPTTPPPLSLKTAASSSTSASPTAPSPVPRPLPAPSLVRREEPRPHRRCRQAARAVAAPGNPPLRPAKPQTLTSSPIHEFRTPTARDTSRRRYLRTLEQALTRHFPAGKSKASAPPWISSTASAPPTPAAF